MREVVHSSKYCQMLSWWTKNLLHSINTRDTATNVIPLCSVYQASFYEPNLTLLAWFLPEFAYLSMLFILEMQEVQAISNKQTLHEIILEM